MSVKPIRYRIEERRHTDAGDTTVNVVDMLFGRTLSKEAAEAAVAWELLRNAGLYAPYTSSRLVVTVSPEVQP